MSKKLFTLLLTSLLAFSVVACGEAKEEKKAAEYKKKQTNIDRYK